MRLTFAAAAVLCVSTLAAHADTFVFTSGSTSLTFSLPESPVPFLAVQGTGFSIAGVTASTGSASEQIDLAFYDMNGSLQDGGFAYEIESTMQVFRFSGPQVYTGLDAAPTFVDGNYDLQGGTLQITGGSVTPEPSTFALLGTGLMGIAGVVRKRLV